AINVIYSAGELWAIMAISAAILVIFVVRGLAIYGQAVLLATVNLTIASEYRILLFARVLRENLGYFANRHSGGVNGTLNFASGSVGGVLTTLVVAAGRNLVTLIALVGVMFVQAPLPSLVCCIVMPIGAIGVRRIRDQVRELTERQFRQNNALFET